MKGGIKQHVTGLPKLPLPLSRDSRLQPGNAEKGGNVAEGGEAARKTAGPHVDDERKTFWFKSSGIFRTDVACDLPQCII